MTTLEKSIDERAALGFDPEGRYRLSRHLHLRPTDDSSLIAESLLTGCSLRLTNTTQVALVLRFLEATRPSELIAGLDPMRQSALLDFLAHLYSSAVLTAINNQDEAEDEDDPLRHWEAHDLFLHVRSRRGRTPFTVGATYHLAESLQEAPPFKPSSAAIDVALPKAPTPAPEGLSLSDALSNRRTRYSIAPLDLDTLGEFLERTCRVTGQRRLANGEVLLKRVYPSGGSLHSLEVYVIPARCAGLDLGLYHYRSQEHGLEAMSGPSAEIDGLLEEARRGTGQLEEVPSVLLVLSARFRRVARKYQGLAYRLILKEVGAIYQTFYLVATDMGLSPCALGTGDSDSFARAAGTNYFEETSVGEFILGGPAA